VVVTRAAEQAGELADTLEEAGATPLLCPTIQILAPESWGGLDAALDRVDVYDWVVFTSSNGVRSVAARLQARGLAAAVLATARLAAVGDSTALELARHGLQAAFVPTQQRSRALAEALPDVQGASLLLMRADIAGSSLAETLSRRGAAQVDDVIAYRTALLAPSGGALEELRRGFDGITFTSPSTVRGFVAMGPRWRSLLAEAAIVTLGPATTEAVREQGLPVAAEATERSMKGLVGAVETALGQVERIDEDERT
jgi:uroporphyrinogen III methyltransferase/synthase